jgi:hypothetical protein
MHFSPGYYDEESKIPQFKQDFRAEDDIALFIHVEIEDCDMLDYSYVQIHRLPSLLDWHFSAVQSIRSPAGQPGGFG